MNRKFVPGKLVAVVENTGRVAGYFRSNILVDQHESIALIHPGNHNLISESIPILRMYAPKNLRLEESE